MQTLTARGLAPKLGGYRRWLQTDVTLSKKEHSYVLLVKNLADMQGFFSMSVAAPS